MECLAKVARCKTGEPIYCQEDPAHFWYRIVTGAARSCVLLADGRRQIVDFLMPGDLFGVGEGQAHLFSVEAIIAETTVARYPRRRVEVLAESDVEVGRQLRETAFNSIMRLQQRMLLLARTRAIEKVGSFLIEMADRSSPATENTVALPMSRYDIADYLAIAVETVSRALTQLRQRGAIVLDSSRVVRIIDRGALQEGCTVRH